MADGRTNDGPPRTTKRRFFRFLKKRPVHTHTNTQRLTIKVKVSKFPSPLPLHD